MKLPLEAAAALVLSALVPSIATPVSPPPLIQYQGLALDPAGSPIQSPVDMVFAIFDDAQAGEELWTESHAAVPVTDGVFSVLLGSDQSLLPSLFSDGDRWLEVRIDGVALSPRQHMSSVPWALQSGCTPGDILHCYSGGASTLEVGQCRPGNRVCDADGRWGACSGEVLPAAETCLDGLDNDCNGEIDDGCPVCGDGIVTGGEGCDDGNTFGGDGCSAACQLEVCGNSVVDFGEDCDDGNNVNGDGCSATCVFEDAQIAPLDANFNNPLDIQLDSTVSVTDFVSFPGGDTQDRVRHQVLGMNPNPVLSGGVARLRIAASCFGTNVSEIQFLVAGQTYGCGQLLVDREVTADTDTGTITITAVGGVGTYVQWVLTGTATRVN